MFVLSIVRPPVEPAAFGRATVLETEPKAELFDSVSAFMAEHFGSLGPVNVVGSLAYKLANTDTGTDVYDPATGCTFRLDPADRAPNVCPCDGCGRLVNWQDHALAGSDDAYCLGCFTWDRGVPQCLPENSAHTEEPS